MAMPTLVKEKEKGAQTADEHTKAGTSPMTHIVEQWQARPSVGDIVEGVVVHKEHGVLYVDLAPFGTGIIYGREYINARDIAKRVAVDDTIAAKVVEKENEEGYIELSLKEARRALIWGEAEDAVRSQTVFELPVKEANKGGLILEWQGVQGFLPASQLKPEHYPRVEDGDKEKVLAELRALVGKRLSVSVLTADQDEEKLIFTEKGPQEKEQGELAHKYTVGDVVEGEITGIVDFGLFIKVEDGLEGLVHISEMDWGLVENPRTMFSVGEAVQAKVIEVKDGKISLSIKALKENPWSNAETKYAKGDTVSGVVLKYNKHGALISIEEGIAGLVHVSEFGSTDHLREELELGKSYDFKITNFDPAEQRLTFSYKEAHGAPATPSAEEPAEQSPEE